MTKGIYQRAELDTCLFSSWHSQILKVYDTQDSLIQKKKKKKLCWYADFKARALIECVYLTIYSSSVCHKVTFLLTMFLSLNFKFQFTFYCFV